MNAVTEVVAKAVQARKGGDAWGLYLDKLCFHPGEGQSAKGESLECVREVYDHCKPKLQQAVDRRIAFRQHLATHYGPEHVLVVHLRSTNRLLVHLARANPLENVGLYAERITGLPMIPGPAVKGIVSTWACWCQNIQPDGGFPAEFATHRRQFNREEAGLATDVLGDNDPKGSKGAAQIIFLGAWPETVPTLELDITTPHPNEEKKEGPIPNPFLAIAPGTDWAFVLIAKPRNGTDAKPLLDAAQVWLTEALDQAGIGAKTAAGYGRFRPLTETELCELRKRDDATAKKFADAKAALIAKQQAATEIASLQPDPTTLAALAAIKNDGDLFGKVNPYKTEEGLAGFKWPGTPAQQLAVLEFCGKTAWSRVSGNKNCRKALQNLARKFNRELPA